MERIFEGADWDQGLVGATKVGATDYVSCLKHVSCLGAGSNAARGMGLPDRKRVALSRNRATLSQKRVALSPNRAALSHLKRATLSHHHAVQGNLRRDSAARPYSVYFL